MAKMNNALLNKCKKAIAMGKACTLTPDEIKTLLLKTSPVDVRIISTPAKKYTHYCSKCDEGFTEYKTYEYHKWISHPTNKYERHWKENRNKIGGFYRDDPYY